MDREEYSAKKVRPKIEDEKAKRYYIEKNSSQSRKTCNDEITGKRIYKHKSEAPIPKSDRVANVDHIIPLEETYKRTKDNPFLSDDAIKRIANDASNLILTNEKLNKSKGSKNNFEYANGHKNDLSKQEIKNLKKAQIKSEANMAKNIAKETFKEINNVGKEGVKNGAIYGGISSGLRNVADVVNGEKDISEAVMQTGVDTAKAAATGYAIEIVKKMGKDTLGKSAQKAGKEVTEQIGKVLGNSGAIGIVIELKDVGNATVKFVKGELSEEEFVQELVKDGIAIVGSIAGTFIGGKIGGKIGGVVGSAIGDFVGYMIGSAVFRALSAENSLDKELQRYTNLQLQLEGYKKSLEDFMEQIDLEYHEEVAQSLQSLCKAIGETDTIEELNTMLLAFYERYNLKKPWNGDFDEHMADKNAFLVFE